MHGVPQIDPTYARQINRSTENYKLCHKGLKDYATDYSDEKFAKLQLEKTKKKQFDSWLYSKVHCITVIMNAINGIKNTEKQKQVCEDLYLYANSRSSLSKLPVLETGINNT